MPRGRPKEFDRDEALGLALATFQQNGYGATALSDLTAAMGIGRQSLYDTFGDKRSLFLEALRSYCELQHERLGAVLRADGPPGARLASFLDAWAEAAAGEMAQGCLIVKSLQEFAAEEDAEVHGLLRRQMERMHDLVAGAVQECIDAGVVDSGLGAREVTRTLMAAADGVILKARVQDAGPIARDVSSTLKRLLGL
jgi:AcrR family transcriptional regulator